MKKKYWYQDKHEIIMMLKEIGSEVRVKADKIAKHPSIVNTLGKAIGQCAGFLRELEANKIPQEFPEADIEVKALLRFLKQR